MVIVVAAWMLDPAACAGMTFGAPRVSISALADLHHLLIERGFRRNSPGDSTIVQEEQDEKTPADTDAASRSPAPAQHFVRFRKTPGINSSERRAALARLARLLLEAAGVVAEERDDDDR